MAPKIWLMVSLAKRRDTETPLTNATVKRGLPVPKFLELFVTVCDIQIKFFHACIDLV